MLAPEVGRGPTCPETLGKLIEFVDNLPDEEARQALSGIMLLVQIDLGSAILTAMAANERTIDLLRTQEAVPPAS